MVVRSALVLQQDATAVRLACGQHTLLPGCVQGNVQEIILETAHYPLLFKDMVLHMKSGYKQENLHLHLVICICSRRGIQSVFISLKHPCYS